MDPDASSSHLDFLGGVLALRPQPGDGSPEISWGDVFFYYAPDGVVPPTQPFATIVTKDYPGEPPSQLSKPGSFRVNVTAGADAFTRWTGNSPREGATSDVDPTSGDVVVPHPVYARAGWLAIVNPGPQTTDALVDLLTAAHAAARARYERAARGLGAGTDGS